MVQSRFLMNVTKFITYILQKVLKINSLLNLMIKQLKLGVIQVKR